MEKLIVRGKDAPSCLPHLPWDVPVFVDGRLAGLKRRVRWVIPEKPNSEYRVLVVNDEKDIAFLLAELLTRWGYQVATAHDGVEALIAIARDKPDLILLNVIMPKLDGLGVLSRLRGDPATKDLKVVVHSARPYARAAQALGAQGFMAVPFSPQDVYSSVSRVLRS